MVLHLCSSRQNDARSSNHHSTKPQFVKIATKHYASVRAIHSSRIASGRSEYVPYNAHVILHCSCPGQQSIHFSLALLPQNFSFSIALASLISRYVFLKKQTSIGCDQPLVFGEWHTVMEFYCCSLHHRHTAWC